VCATQTLFSDDTTSTQTLTAQTQTLNQRVSHLLALADSHNPLKKLAQGYSITHHNQQALGSIATVQPGDSITTRVSDGAIISQIQQILPKAPLLQNQA
jgi:exonuclease VII large subunit